jgi:hypothetical protein
VIPAGRFQGGVFTERICLGSGVATGESKNWPNFTGAERWTKAGLSFAETASSGTVSAALTAGSPGAAFLSMVLQFRDSSTPAPVCKDDENDRSQYEHLAHDGGLVCVIIMPSAMDPASKRGGTRRVLGS